MANACKSMVTLLYVIPSKGSGSERLTPSQRIAREDTGGYLERTAETLRRRAVQTEWRISTGDPAEQIVRQATTGRHDVVMMSTRGQGGERQVPKNDAVLVSTQGGILDHHATLILSPNPSNQ